MSTTKSIDDIFKDMLYDSAGKKLTDEMFSLPKDSDFMQDSFSVDLLNSINKTDLEHPFYLETPFETTPGYYDEERVFIIKATPYNSKYIEKYQGGNTYLLNKAKEGEALYKDDGDTIQFMNDSVISGISSFQLGTRTYTNFEELLNVTDNREGHFSVRFVGIDAPEIPHYMTVPLKVSQIKTHTFGNIKNKSNFIYSNEFKHKDSDILKFYQNDGRWIEVIEEHFEEAYSNLTIDKKANLTDLGVTICKVLFIDSSKEDTVGAGIEAALDARRLIGEAEDMVIMIDHKSISRQSTDFGSIYDVDYFKGAVASNMWKTVTSYWDRFFSDQRYKYLGLNAYGQENNRRFLGTIYLKVKLDGISREAVWINLTKYIIQKHSKTVEAIPDYTSDPLKQLHSGFVSDEFKLWTYNFKNMVTLDAFTSYTEDHIKERDLLFEKMAGVPFDNIIEQKLILGDTILIIPPTSIRCVTQLQTKREQLLRSRGSALKSAPKSEKIIEMKLYFNSDSGINGTPYEVTYPNGKKGTYWMNGLRALIAQFKLTPFLPIENKYINEVLNTFAVTLVDLQINTMPGYPKCLEATLTLQEFNYRVYMSDLPVPSITTEKDLYTNLFARTIHYPAMRWYYQRLIQKGEEIKNLPFNSYEYINETFGKNTALIPMDFKDSKVDFYLPDKNWLDIRLEAALEKEAKPLRPNYPLTDNIKDVVKDAAPFYDILLNNMKKPETASALKNLMSPAITQTTFSHQWMDDPTGTKNSSSRPHYNLAFTMIDHGGVTEGVLSKFRYWKNLGLLSRENIETSSSKIVEGMGYKEALDAYLESVTENIPGVEYDFHGGTGDDRYKVRFHNMAKGAYYIDLLIPLSQKLLEPLEKEEFTKYMISILELNDNNEVFTYNSSGMICARVALKMEMTFYDLFDIELTEYTDFIATPISDFKIDSGSGGFGFLAYCDSSVKKIESEDGSVVVEYVGNNDSNMQEDLQDVDQYNHIDSAESIKFVKYELGEDLNIESLNCIYSNSLTRIGLNSMDGYAHQFCGGQDIIVEAKFTTKSEVVASLLSNLPALATNMIIDYRNILSVWPLRLDSQITKLFGVNEVLIESVDTTTVPNHPGIYAINVRMVAVDRSTRNKESLKKIEGINNSGAQNIENQAYTTRNFFDLNKVLGKAEIYPDLELPTVDEFEYAGYKITKLYNQDQPTRKYLDPDFYFIYGHALAHETIRSGIMQAFDSADGYKTILSSKFDITDKEGAWYQIEGDKNEVLKASAQNEIAVEIESAFKDAYEKELNHINDITRQEVFNNLKLENQISSKLSQTLAGLQTPIWYISDNMTFPLREKQFEYVMKDDDKVYVDHIKSVEDKVEKIISDELESAMDMSNYGVKDFALEKLGASQLGSVSKSTKWAEKRIKKLVGKFITENEFIGNLAHDTTTNYNHLFSSSKIEKMLLALADGATGLSYCEQTKRVVGLSTQDEKYENLNWKLRPFFNAGSITDNYKEKVVPYCKIINKNDSQVIFANNITEGIEKGYSFGVFQIRLYDKQEIMPYINEDERVRLKSSKIELFFLDDYYRNLQLTDPTSEELVYYKRQLLVDPAFGAYAALRNMMFWYRALIQDNAVISMYESIKTKAVSLYDQSAGSYTDSQYKVSADSNNKTKKSLNKETNKSIDDTFEKYIDVFASSYARILKDEKVDAISDEGLSNNGVPSDTDVMTAAKKFKNNTDKLIKKYEKRVEKIKKQMEKNTQDIASDISKEAKQTENRTLQTELDLLNSFMRILKTDSIEEVVRFGNQIAIMKNTIKEESAINNQTFLKVFEQLQESSYEIIVGKLLGLSLLMQNGSSKVYNLIKARDVNNLKALMLSLVDVSVSNTNSEMRKFLLALDGRGVITLDYVGKQEQSAEELIALAAAERVAISRSNTPDYYLRDSYLDMIKYDKRGRMLRAFPTYYMMFVDEGRKIGLWKLHDNFYNMNAISEITVTKSRKIASDTAQITMSNMFKTYSTEDAQRDYDSLELNNVRYNMRDAFNSIFSPRTYFMKEELKRDMQELKRTTEIVPGVRMQLRLGYGSNAADLPVVFNGNVAEVGASDIVEIVAQGDGAELLNPIMDIDDSSDIDNKEKFIISRIWSNWIKNGATPREIMLALLMAKGTWMQEQIRKYTKGRFYNYNPYGITHFGDIDFKKVFSSGEVGQNIFEANPKATYGTADTYTGLEGNYDTKETPVIAMHLLGKTVWDVMHICASVQPDYIASVVPFGMRSSIFYGNGRYYYAYDYEKKVLQNGDSMIVEKRKPFQQQHIYTSFTDIIHNNIRASAKEIKTNAVGLYQETLLFRGDQTAQVGPLYADFSIYPEFQKSMTVDTQLWAKGLPIVGNVFGWTADLSHDVSSEGLNPIPGAKEIAWRMTASGLKNSMKDMYTGELTVIGDTTVKPYDRVWMEDAYERMSGCFEVEAVVHSFNATTGFTSSIYADCINVVEDRYEQYAISKCSQAVGLAIATVGLNSLIWSRFDKAGRPLTSSALKAAGVAANTSAKVIDSVGSFLGKDDLKIASKLIQGNDKLTSLSGINGTSTFLTGFIDDISSVAKNMSKVSASDLKTLSQLEDYLNSTLKAHKKVTNSQLKKELSGKGLTSQYNNITKELTQAISSANELSPAMRKEIGKLAAELATKGSDEAIKAAGILSEFSKDALKLSNVNDISKFSSAIKTAGTHLDDDIVMGMLKSTKSINKNADDIAKAALNVAKNVDTGDIKAVMKIKAAARASLPGLILTALEIIGTAVIGGYVSEWLYRYVQNLQVLQIYPLKRNGRVMVAGIDGHKGTVVGSPTYNQEDEWTNFIISMLDGKDKGLLENILDFTVLNDEIKNACARIRKQNDNPDVYSGITQEELKQKIANDVGTIYASKTQKDTRYLIYHERIKKLSGEIGRTYLDANTIELRAPYESPKHSDLVEFTYPIAEDEALKKYLDNELLYVLHDPRSGEMKTERMSFQGQTVDVPYHVYNGVFNIPCLRLDAMVALRDCIDQYTELTDYSSMHFSNQGTKKLPQIVLTSALVLGDKNALWESTGLAFRLNFPGYDRFGIGAKNFLDHMKKFYKDQGAENFIDGKVTGQTIVFCVKPVVNN